MAGAKIEAYPGREREGSGRREEGSHCIPFLQMVLVFIRRLFPLQTQVRRRRAQTDVRRPTCAHRRAKTGDRRARTAVIFP